MLPPTLKLRRTSRRFAPRKDKGFARRYIGLLVAFFLCATTASALEESEEIKLKYFEQKEGRVAFTYTSKDQKDIYIIDFNTLTVHPLVTDAALDEYPAWSPDGRLIAFYSDRAKNRDIYLIGDDGSGLTQLTDSPDLDEDPDWSPDGAYLVYRSESRDGTHSIIVMNQDGSNKRPIVKDKRTISVPKWSPRGTEIIYSSSAYWPGWDVMLHEVNTGKGLLLTNGIQSFLRPSWHPSGGSFLVSYGAAENIDIYLFEKGAQSVKQLIARPGKDYDAVWIDDAKRVLFAGEIEPGSSRYEIFVWERQTGKIFQVTESNGQIRHLAWTPLPSIRTLAEGYAEQLRGNSDN